MTPSARIHRLVRTAAVTVLALAGAQCSVDRTQAPSLTGPSERALSTVVTATPDQLPRDGVSQSTISVVARDANAQPLAGQAFDITVNPPTAILSAQSVVTGGDGVAWFTLTTLPPGGAAPNDSIRVSVLPVGTNAAANVHVNGDVDRRTVTVRLLGPSNTTAPTAAFQITTVDAGRTIGKAVSFDAGASTDEDFDGDGTADACGSKCTYIWSFGDGGTGTGRVASHVYSSVGTFAVTLTVVDASGTQDSVTQFVTIGIGTLPTAALNCSPSDPVVGQSVVCDAAASTVEPGATVESYEWAWGDGNLSVTTSSVASHPDGGYAAAGTYTVRVTVTDNFGRQHTVTAEVEVSEP